MLNGRTRNLQDMLLTPRKMVMPAAMLVSGFMLVSFLNVWPRHEQGGSSLSVGQLRDIHIEQDGSLFRANELHITPARNVPDRDVDQVTLSLERTRFFAPFDYGNPHFLVFWDVLDSTAAVERLADAIEYLNSSPLIADVSRVYLGERGVPIRVCFDRWGEPLDWGC